MKGVVLLGDRKLELRPAHDMAYGRRAARLQECTTGMTSLA